MDGWREIFVSLPLPCFRLHRRLCDLSAGKSVKCGYHSYSLAVKSKDLSFDRLVYKTVILIVVPIHCSLSGSPFPLLLNFIDMLKTGKSKPWPEAQKKLTGSETLDVGALTQYFEPFRKWMVEQREELDRIRRSWMG